MSADYRQYASAKAAAARYARLAQSLPGTVQAIDYERMAQPGYGGGDPETAQDIALEALDEYHDLGRAFDAAARQIGEEKFTIWRRVRVEGYGVGELALCVCERTAYRVLRRCDAAVEGALIERDSIRGMEGRDLIEAGGSQAKGIAVWKNPDAFPEEPQ